MQNLKIDLKKFFSLILFFLNPILGFIYSIYNVHKKNNRTLIFIIIALFFSVLTIKNPPVHDIYRYLLRFDNINTLKDIGLYTNDYFFDYLTLTFKFFNLPFFLLPSIFIFLTVFLELKSVDRIINYYNLSKKNTFIIILFTLVIINPINISLGLRSHLSFAFFLYGLTSIITTSNKKYFLYFILAFITHTAIFPLILSYFISIYFKPNKLLTIMLSVICFFISAVILKSVFSLNFFAENFNTLTVYTEFDNLSDKSNRGLIFFYINISIKLLVIAIYLFAFKIKNTNQTDMKFFYFINVLLITTCACYFSEIAFGRYTGYVAILSIIILLTRNIRNKILSIFLLFYFSYTLLIINIYINRHHIITGDYITQAIKPPLMIMLYSDEDYRKLLSNTDIDGYPISGPGSR